MRARPLHLGFWVALAAAVVVALTASPPSPDGIYYDDAALNVSALGFLSAITGLLATSRRGPQPTNAPGWICRTAVAAQISVLVTAALMWLWPVGVVASALHIGDGNNPYDVGEYLIVTVGAGVPAFAIAAVIAVAAGLQARRAHDRPARGTGTPATSGARARNGLAWALTVPTLWTSYYVNTHRSGDTLNYLAIVALTVAFTSVLATRRAARRPENVPGWGSRIFAALAFACLTTIVFAWFPVNPPSRRLGDADAEDWYPMVATLVGGVAFLLSGALALALAGYARYRRRVLPHAAAQKATPMPMVMS